MSDKPWLAGVAALAAASVVALACGSEEATRPGGPNCVGAKCDDVEGGGEDDAIEDGPEHREAIEACEVAAERLRDRTHEQRFDGHAALERERTSCLKAANDDIVPPIDMAVRVRNDRLAGVLERAVDQLRDARGDLCLTMVESSEDALQKSGAVSEMRCGAQSELDLANLIGAYAALGVDQEELVEARVRYPDCWEAFDNEVAEAGVASQTLKAHEVLAGCMQQDNDEARMELVDKLEMQFPGRKPESLEEDSKRTFRLHDNAIKDVCEVLSTAGPSVVPSDVELAWMQCRVHGISMVGQLGNLVIPGVWPEGSEAGTEDGGGEEGGSDEGGSDDGGTDEGGTGGGSDEGGGSSDGSGSDGATTG